MMTQLRLEHSIQPCTWWVATSEPGYITWEPFLTIKYYAPIAHFVLPNSHLTLAPRFIAESVVTSSEICEVLETLYIFIYLFFFSLILIPISSPSTSPNPSPHLPLSLEQLLHCSLTKQKATVHKSSYHGWTRNPGGGKGSQV